MSVVVDVVLQALGVSGMGVLIVRLEDGIVIAYIEHGCGGRVVLRMVRRARPKVVNDVGREVVPRRENTTPSITIITPRYYRMCTIKRNRENT